MWKGKVTEELYIKYAELFDGMYPDEFDDIAYYARDYEEFVGYIKECIKQKKEMDEIVI